MSWISIKDSAPPEKHKVLVIAEDGAILIACLLEETWWTEQYIVFPTHWQELPKGL